MAATPILVAVIGRDQPGIVACVSSVMTRLKCNIIRMTQAAFLLMETSLPVTEVAERVGFNDLPTFRKHFTDMFGVSPSKYAEDNQKNK